MIDQIVKGLEISHLSSIGVYCIFHEKYPDRLYVGSTAKSKSDRASHRGFYKRFYDHLRELKLKKHHSKYLQNVVNKYGLEGVGFKIIEMCPTLSYMEIRVKEQFYIESLKPVYNSLPQVYPKGRVWTIKEKKKQSKKMTGKSLPESVYKKIRRPVLQRDSHSFIVGVFSCMLKASQVTGIDCGSINKAASGKRKTAGGFTWEFYTH